MKITTKNMKVGDVYNRLTLISLETNIKTSHKKYLFQCSCGNLKEIRPYFVIMGRSTSCGCYNKEIIKRKDNKFKRAYGESSKNHLFLVYKRGAVERNLEFILSMEEFTKLTSNECHYCGVIPHRSTGRSKYAKVNGDYIYNGIDRKNNLQGYTLNNCVSCCYTCNRAKHDLTYEQMLKWIDRLLERKLSERQLQKEQNNE